MNHSDAAERIADIILNGKETIQTEYGVKTAEGIADLIDRETDFYDTLIALRNLLHCVESNVISRGTPRMWFDKWDDVIKTRAILSKHQMEEKT